MSEHNKGAEQAPTVHAEHADAPEGAEAKGQDEEPMGAPSEGWAAQAREAAGSVYAHGHFL